MGFRVVLAPIDQKPMLSTIATSLAVFERIANFSPRALAKLELFSDGSFHHTREGAAEKQVGTWSLKGRRFVLKFPGTTIDTVLSRNSKFFTEKGVVRGKLVSGKL